MRSVSTIYTWHAMWYVTIVDRWHHRRRSTSTSWTWTISNYLPSVHFRLSFIDNNDNNTGAADKHTVQQLCPATFYTAFTVHQTLHDSTNCNKIVPHACGLSDESIQLHSWLKATMAKFCCRKDWNRAITSSFVKVRTKYVSLLACMASLPVFC